MVHDQLQFSERLRLLERKHRAMSCGYTTTMQSDGLIVARPKRRSIEISGRSLGLLVVGFIGFKVFLIASLGMQTYDERLARLQAGTPVEQIGAFAMQADPLSSYLAAEARQILR